MVQYSTEVQNCRHCTVSTLLLVCAKQDFLGNTSNIITSISITVSTSIIPYKQCYVNYCLHCCMYTSFPTVQCFHSNTSSRMFSKGMLPQQNSVEHELSLALNVMVLDDVICHTSQGVADIAHVELNSAEAALETFCKLPVVKSSCSKHQ